MNETGRRTKELLDADMLPVLRLRGIQGPEGNIIKPYKYGGLGACWRVPTSLERMIIGGHQDLELWIN